MANQPPSNDLTVVSLLRPNVVPAMEASEGAALEAGELRQHTNDDTKCSELGWVCMQ